MFASLVFTDLFVCYSSILSHSTYVAIYLDEM